MIENLFIGGSHDGERIMIRDLPIVRLPKKALAMGLQTQPINEEIYKRHQFGTNDRQFYLFIIEGMSCSEAFERLLEHYKRITVPLLC